MRSPKAAFCCCGQASSALCSQHLCPPARRVTDVIDWCSVTAAFAHSEPIREHRWELISRDGELIGARDAPVLIESDLGSCVRIATARSGDPLSSVHLSGNFAKLLQNHNVFGTGDVCGLTAEALSQCLQVLGYEPTDAIRQRWLEGDFVVHQIDIAGSYSLGTRERAEAAVRHIGQSGYWSRRGRASTEPNTAYFGKSSRRSVLKVYAKLQELEASGHELSENLSHRSAILDWCNDELRVEIRLHATELSRLGLRRGAAWIGRDPTELMRSYLARLSVPPMRGLRESLLERLRPREKVIYLAWSADGAELRNNVPGATFHRWRRALLPHGIDIASVPPDDTWDDIDLAAIFAAPPKAIPEWAYGTSILACDGGPDTRPPPDRWRTAVMPQRLSRPTPSHPVSEPQR